MTLYSGVMEDGTPRDDPIFWCASRDHPETVPNWIALRCGGSAAQGEQADPADESTLLNTAWTVEHASGTDVPSPTSSAVSAPNRS